MHSLMHRSSCDRLLLSDLRRVSLKNLNKHSFSDFANPKLIILTCSEELAAATG